MRMRLLSALLLCFVGFSSSGQTDCGWNPDANGDNEIGVPDLLALLSVFEEQDSDDDGIWDSQDDCIGVYDECGVCNGPGPDFPVIESIEVTYDSVFIPQIEEWYVFELSTDTTFTFVCAPAGCTDPEAANFNPDAIIDDGSCSYGPPECGGATTVTFDGYTYDLVAIGSQCWFAENLRTTTYANGDSIPGNLTDSEWISTTSGATTVYGEGGSSVLDGSGDEEANLEAFGRLYNWYAADDSRGLCPNGWHVPTDGEWTELIDAIGYPAGTSMRSSPADTPSWTGTNTSGFSALPGGWREGYEGYFIFGGTHASWWSASATDSSHAWNRRIFFNHSDVFTFNALLQFGFSVRCLRDE